MKAVILAAGEETPLRPTTGEIPAPLVEVNDKPISTYCFETLIGIGEAVVVGYEKDEITERYGTRFGGSGSLMRVS